MKTLSYDQVFSQAWNSINTKLPTAVGLTLLYLVLAGVLSWIPILGILALPLHGGYVLCLVQLRADKPVDYRDLFWVFSDLNRFIQYYVLMLFYLVIVIVGLIVFVIPGIYLAISLWLASTYFILRKPDAVAALKAARHLSVHHWWFMAGLVILLGILNLVGCACLGVGLLVTMPLSVLVLVATIEAIEAAPIELQATPIS